MIFEGIVCEVNSNVISYLHHLSVVIMLKEAMTVVTYTNRIDQESTLHIPKDINLSSVTFACDGKAFEVPSQAFMTAHSTGEEMLGAANYFLNHVVFALAPLLVRHACTAFKIAVYNQEEESWIILVCMGGKIGERESIRADEEEYAMLFSKERRMYGKVSQVKIYIRSKGLLDWCIPGSWYLKNVSRWLETLPL